MEEATETVARVVMVAMPEVMEVAMEEAMEKVMEAAMEAAMEVAMEDNCLDTVVLVKVTRLHRTLHMVDRPIPAVLVPTPVLLTAHLVLTKDLHTVDLHTVEPTKQSYPISLPKMSRLSFDQMHMAIFIHGIR